MTPRETRLNSMKTLLLFRFHEGSGWAPFVTLTASESDNAVRALILALPGVKVRCVFTIWACVTTRRRVTCGGRRRHSRRAQIGLDLSRPATASSSVCAHRRNASRRRYWGSVAARSLNLRAKSRRSAAVVSRDASVRRSMPAIPTIGSNADEKSDVPRFILRLAQCPIRPGSGLWLLMAEDRAEPMPRAMRDGGHAKLHLWQ
jgi:hypothetical protein